MSIGVIGSILLCVLLSALAQVTMKAGMSSPAVKSNLSDSAVLDTILSIALNPYVAGGLIIYGIGTVLWLLVLARVDVSQAYPFVGLGFVLTMAMGHVFLGEPISAYRLLGTVLVVSGVVLIAR